MNIKFKVLALTFSMLFFGSITATSIAQVVSSPNSITVTDEDDDKDKNKKKSKTTAKSDATDVKSCKEKKKCCNSGVMLKDENCKDKKSDPDKK